MIVRPEYRQLNSQLMNDDSIIELPLATKLGKRPSLQQEMRTRALPRAWMCKPAT